MKREPRAGLAKPATNTAPKPLAPKVVPPTDAVPAVDTRRAAQVSRWARAGYWLLPGIAVLLLAITVALVPMSGEGRAIARFAAAALFLGFPAIQILLALRFETPEPAGHRITAGEAPALFEAIEDARAKLDAPKIDAVYIDRGFNAGALERPVRGVFGGWQRDMIIGLPMMLALSPKELTGVIGHELGHFAGAHGRRHRQVLRTQVAWAEMMSRLESMRFGGITFALMAQIGNWYVPHLMQMASKLARDDEFEADRAEATVVGALAAGEAHVRIQVAAKFLKCIVEEYHAANVTGDAPELRLFALMAETLPSAVAWPEAPAALDVALKEKTDTFDDHPCMAERLAALGCTGRLPPELTADATSLLGEDLRAAFIAGFDEAWWADNAETWVVQGVRNNRLALLEQAAAENCEPMQRLQEAAVQDDSADVEQTEQALAAVA